MRDRTNPAADDACPWCGWWRCRCQDQVTRVTDSDPDMDEALRRVRTGGRR